MALKNTYARLHAGAYIQGAQDALVKAGATGIQTEYEDGRIVSLAFLLKINESIINFRLPVNWRNFQNVLKKEKNPRSKDDNYCYKVAWACTKDWIEAQMAFVESENVTVPQVFLPYAVGKNNKTLFENIANNPGNLLLGDGNNK